MKRLLPWIVAVWCLLFGAQAQAASFDCAKASTKVEKLICGDVGLSKLDDELAVAYKAALQDGKQAESIRQAQKQWLKERNACVDADCVKRAYEVRMQGLSSSTAVMRADPDDGAATRQSSTASAPKEPLYGHCVDVGIPHSCEERGQTGKGYVVCETYLRYLNTLPEAPKCEVPVPPGFKQPEWEEVDFMQHLDWAYQIARNRFLGTEKMAFEKWKPLFLSDVKKGRIVPQMRKTHVQPLEGETVTLLAFTEDRLGCKRPAIPENNRYSNWDGVGFLYFLLTDDPKAPLQEIGGGFDSASHKESVLLLYAGKPYFVRGDKMYTAPFEMELDILNFNPRAWTISEQKIYWTRRLCQFSLVSKGKPYRENQTTPRK